MLRFIKRWIPVRRYWLMSNFEGIGVIGSTVKSELEHCMRVDNVRPIPYWAWRYNWKPLWGKDLMHE